MIAHGKTPTYQYLSINYLLPLYYYCHNLYTSVTSLHIDFYDKSNLDNIVEDLYYYCYKGIDNCKDDVDEIDVRVGVK